MNSNSRESKSIADVEILTRDRLYSVNEVCTLCQLDESGLQEYIDYGVLVIESRTTVSARINQSQLDRLLRARRLQQDLELNHAGVALALDLLDTIAELKREIDLLRR